MDGWIVVGRECPEWKQSDLDEAVRSWRYGFHEMAGLEAAQTHDQESRKMG